ncbi:cobalt ECF transporter T component CbiQ [Curvivirga aplysinae]|uniref:cobalt ECF transporter T component CbiQ n=1 Tax=Curvivirga aplysinae TaxID=2529852 RepID=UPI0012BC3814|nr:cobalt ECF transporter T component CbiQ [Curvivirga aplysinae]MTI11232.1 cobalt ECF transporter T component CbiQ [Curvivirga aplysinae]
MSEILEVEQQSWTDSQSTEQESFLRSLDPRARVVASVIFSVTVVSLNNLAVLTVALFFAIALMMSARMPASKTLKRMAAMDGFIIFMLVMLPFTMKGEAMFHVFGFAASWEGLWKAIAIALKANAAVLSLMALVGSMESVTFGHALHRLKVPTNLVHLLLFTVRYIEVLHEEYQRLRNAMKTRGFRPRNSWHTYQSFGYLIGMMLVRALERSERILKAMKCRGFAGHIPMLNDFQFQTRDLFFILFFAGVLVSLVLLEVFNALSY